MSSGRVLLVCDGLWEFPFHGGILASLGYDVDMSSSYEEGIRRLEMEDFDFVIVNQGSASFEGRCVLKRAAELHRNIPIVVVTRCLDIHCYLEATDLGAVDYLERPQSHDIGWRWKPNCAGATQLEDYQPCEVARIQG